MLYCDVPVVAHTHAYFLEVIVVGNARSSVNMPFEKRREHTRKVERYTAELLSRNKLF